MGGIVDARGEPARPPTKRGPRQQLSPEGMRIVARAFLLERRLTSMYYRTEASVARFMGFPGNWREYAWWWLFREIPRQR